MNTRQTTLAAPFQLSGIGIHSGEETAVTCQPAQEDAGIIFIKGTKRIPANSFSLSATKRGTALGGIFVVEHLLSAFYALGVDNVMVEVAGDEIPVMDGSAKPFVEAILLVGIRQQSVSKQAFSLQSPIKIEDKESSLEAWPQDGFVVDFMVDFPPVGKQRLVFDLQKGNYASEIAPARTFGYIEELEALKQQGLGRGASIDNALALSQEGYINLPRFKDEVVRHKILDLIGDLALLGRPLKARIKAAKSGHKMNTELVKRIVEQFS
jgi:UDP-3-O-[3-hydroxymyristoyl] N-acetylglucosamine deacetylase